MEKEIKLHLGCWKRILPGFIHIDLCDLDHIDVKTSVDDLSMFKDESVGLIYASHVLEYFDRLEVNKVLKEWHRVLRPRATLRVAVPDFEALIEVYKRTGIIENILGPMYGKIFVENTDMVMYHKTAYDFRSLKDLLEKNGFNKVRRYRWQDTPPHDKIDDHSQAYFPHMDKKNGILVSLNLEANRA